MAPMVFGSTNPGSEPEDFAPEAVDVKEFDLSSEGPSLLAQKVRYKQRVDSQPPSFPDFSSASNDGHIPGFTAPANLPQPSNSLFDGAHTSSNTMAILAAPSQVSQPTLGPQLVAGAAVLGGAGANGPFNPLSTSISGTLPGTSATANITGGKSVSLNPFDFAVTSFQRGNPSRRQGNAARRNGRPVRPATQTGTSTRSDFGNTTGSFPQNDQPSSTISSGSSLQPPMLTVPATSANDSTSLIQPTEPTTMRSKSIPLKSPPTGPAAERSSTGTSSNTSFNPQSSNVPRGPAADRFSHKPKTRLKAQVKQDDRKGVFAKTPAEFQVPETKTGPSVSTPHNGAERSQKPSKSATAASSGERSQPTMKTTSVAAPSGSSVNSHSPTSTAPSPSSQSISTDAAVRTAVEQAEAVKDSIIKDKGNLIEKLQGQIKDYKDSEETMDSLFTKYEFVFTVQLNLIEKFDLLWSDLKKIEKAAEDASKLTGIEMEPNRVEQYITGSVARIQALVKNNISKKPHPKFRATKETALNTSTAVCLSDVKENESHITHLAGTEGTSQEKYGANMTNSSARKSKEASQLQGVAEVERSTSFPFGNGNCESEGFGAVPEPEPNEKDVMDGKTDVEALSESIIEKDAEIKALQDDLKSEEAKSKQLSQDSMKKDAEIKALQDDLKSEKANSKQLSQANITMGQALEERLREDENFKIKVRRHFAKTGSPVNLDYHHHDIVLRYLRAVHEHLEAATATTGFSFKGPEGYISWSASCIRDLRADINNLKDAEGDFPEMVNLSSPRGDEGRTFGCIYLGDDEPTPKNVKSRPTHNYKLSDVDTTPKSKSVKVLQGNATKVVAAKVKKNTHLPQGEDVLSEPTVFDAFTYFLGLLLLVMCAMGISIGVWNYFEIGTKATSLLCSSATSIARSVSKVTSWIFWKLILKLIFGYGFFMLLRILGVRLPYRYRIPYLI